MVSEGFEVRIDRELLSSTTGSRSFFQESELVSLYFYKFEKSEK